MDKYLKELHETYKSTIKAFSESYSNANKELIKQIDNYSRACAMYLWNVFDTPIGTCVEAINQIYSDVVGPVEYTETHIRNAMKKLSSRNYTMPVPKFFYDIIEYDKENKTNFSSRLAACFQIMDITYALIDGEVTQKEADIIDALQNDLIKACKKDGISLVYIDVNPHQYVKTNYNENLIVTANKTGESIDNCNSTRNQSVPQQRKASGSSVKSKKASMDELDSLIGLEKAKKEIHEVADFAKVQKARVDNGLPVSELSFHLVFTGNPGTGKTTVARLVAQIYKDLGIVSEGHLIEVSAKDLVAGYVGQTAIKTGEVIEKALGGVLFIDEAYTLLDKTGQGYGQEAIDTLLKEMEDKRGDFAVIVAGYDELMHEFINSNPGLKSRFNKYIHFDDYTPDEMYRIFDMLCKKGQYEISSEARKLIEDHFSAVCEKADDSFANGRTVRNVFESIISKQASRIASKRNKTKELLSTIEADDVINSVGEPKKKEETLEDVLNEFKALIGLDMVKEEISELVYIVQNQQRRKEKGLKVPPLSLHLVFMGNPGTGKTTVARCVAKIYKCLGFLSKGQLIETDRSGLVAGYVGQTAIKTQEVIKSALGGVLFIDEAYTLSGGASNDFGQEAIDTLLKAMEDQRDDLVVIVAGYDDLMGDFIRSNPGLESRFNRYIHFEDYSPDQMLSIFESLCDKNQYKLSKEAEDAVMAYFGSVNVSSIGNGRGARNLFEKVVTQQAKRIEKTTDDSNIDLQLITGEDISESLQRGK